MRGRFALLGRRRYATASSGGGTHGLPDSRPRRHCRGDCFGAFHPPDLRPRTPGGRAGGAPGRRREQKRFGMADDLWDRRAPARLDGRGAAPLVKRAPLTVFLLGSAGFQPAFSVRTPVGLRSRIIPPTDRLPRGVRAHAARHVQARRTQWSHRCQWYPQGLRPRAEPRESHQSLDRTAGLPGARCGEGRGRAAIRSNHNAYTPTQGIAELRAQVRAEEQAHTGREWDEDGVLITSGVSGGLFLALSVLIDEGDEVVIPDPYFVMYKHLVRFFGGVPVYLDTYGSDFAIDPERLDACISERTKLVLLNSPSNPTGRILDEANLRAVAEVCARRGVAVLSDEIYRAFAYVDCPSIAQFHEQTLVLGGYSKSYAMTGWRLGYAAGPSEVVQAMAKVQQYSFVCAPSFAQYAALACPDVDLTAPIADYRSKRDLMVGLLEPHFELAPPDGAFYLWAKAPGGNGTAFVEKAIAANVLIIPGNVFSEADTHFRMCYAVPDDVLREGAETLSDLVTG